MNDDAALLRSYAEEGSETAFAELVRRHVNLVYGAALRRNGGDAHGAADVAQQVFTKLAREASRLSRHTVLGAWLHTATHNAALNSMISEQRRRARETAALTLEAATQEGPSPDWDRLRPVLDAAIDELAESDRSAVVLRFLERRPFAEIGNALRVSEDAARMRTDRALDKLRAALARRGITSTAAALAAIVSGQPLISAPTGLVATLTSAALAGSVGGAGVLAATAVPLMSSKILVTAVLSALIAFGVGTYVGLHRPVGAVLPAIELSHDSTTLISLQQENAKLRADLAKARTDLEQVDAVNTQLVAQRAAKPAAVPTVPAKSLTLGMTRGEVQTAVLNNLRQIAAARDQYALDYGHQPGTVDELVGRAKYIKQVRTVGGEDYSALSMENDHPLTVVTPDGLSVTYDPMGETTTKPEISDETARLKEFAQRNDAQLKAAVSAYRAANGGAVPPIPEALLPYFASPQDAAAFSELLAAQKAAGP